MTLRKLFAWLMTLVMLLGMIPAAHAELAGCNHDWDSGKWLRGEPQNCLDWKPKTYTCTICGATATNEECGRCVAGPKTWVRPQGSNCEEYGVWEITCKYCGEWLDGGEEPGPHKWTTRTGRAPTCTESGFRETVCSVCGSEQGGPEEIPALGHDWGNWSWAHGSAPTCTESAWQVRTCKRCGQMEDKWVPAGSHKWGPDTLITAATCIRYGVVGHTCTICGAKESWETDLGSHNWGDWKVSKPGDCVSSGEEKRVCSLCGEEQTRATGGGGHVWGDWKVTKPSTCVEYGREEQKCTRCGLTQWERVALIDHSFTEWYTVMLPAVGVPGLEERKCTMCGLTEERETPALDPETGKLEGGLDFVNGSVVPDNGDDHVNEYPPITLEKFIRNTPANGEYFVPGEVLNYALTLRIPDDLYIDDAAIYDPITGDNLPVISYGKGLWASMGIDVFHTVTEEDAARGYVENTAYATWFYQTTGEAGRCDSNTVTVPCGEEELPDDYQEPGSVELTLIEWSSPANGTHYVPGERIKVLHKLFSNSRDVTMTVDHEHFFQISGDGIKEDDAWPGYIVLLPGKSHGAYAWTPTVTEADAARGYVERTTTFYLMGDDGNEYTATGSIRLPCGPGELPDDYVPPVDDDIDDDGIPNEEDPDMDGDGIPNKEDPDTDGDGIPNEEDPDPNGTGSIRADAMLEKYVKNTPANGEYFVPGETIEYAVIFMNTRSHELHDVEIFDPLKGSNEDITISREPVVEPNGTLYLSFSYVVTEEDAARGTVVNTASAIWLNPEIEEWSSCDSNTVTTPVGPAVSNDVAIIKTIENAPANGVYFVPGEVIEFAITVQNSMDKTLDVVVLTDPLSAYFYHELLDIPGGAMDSRTLSYTVTEMDAVIGNVTNYAHAVAYVDDKSISLTSNTVSAPCGFPDKDGDGQPDDPFGIHSALVVTKEVESLPLNGSYYTEGEKIAYKITYTNAGEARLGETLVYDALFGMTEMASAEFLEPGGSRNAYFSYTVTAEDVTRGYVYNVAMATYDLGGHINTEFSNAVIVDTDGQPDPVPGSPDGSDPIPGVIPDPDQPNWGVIILPPEYQGEDCCKRTLLAWDGTSASYEETFCSVHSVTRNAVLKMLASASTLSAEQMAYDYAIALWKAEVEKQYEVLFQAADSLAQVNIINEYLLFRSQMSNYEALLRNIFSNQPARVSMLLCQEWQTKCLDLCYEMHTAPASRADSFFAVEQAETAAMKATKKCASIKDIELVKRLQYTDVTCTNHSFLFGMTSMLLDGENTAESWQLLYQMWQVEMNKVCNTLAANPASPQAAYAAAEQKLFDQWLAVRTNVLMALYPNNPEIAAEIATRTLMEHVADLCEVCK